MPARPKKKSAAAAKTGKSKSKRPTVASLAAEVAELREQLAALQSRLEAVEAGSSSKSATDVSTGVVAGAAVAAAVVASKPAAKKPAPKKAKARGSRDDTQTALQELLKGALSLALEPMPDDPDDADRLFERFAGLCHSSRWGTPMLDNSLRSYTWRQLRKNVGIYLREEDDPGSFEVLRTDPRKVTEDTRRVKLFLRARTRMPTPITFRRDDELEGEWRVEVSSL